MMADGVERIADAHQPATERRRPDLAATIPHQSPRAGGQPNLVLVLRRRMRREPHEHLARVGHPDRTRGVLSQALDVRGRRVHELEDVLLLHVDAGGRPGPQLSGAILVQAERLGAAESFGLPSSVQRLFGNLNSPRRAATQIVPCRSWIIAVTPGGAPSAVE